MRIECPPQQGDPLMLARIGLMEKVLTAMWPGRGSHPGYLLAVWGQLQLLIL